MEKLFEIHAEDRYDLLVLDTPPSRNALDFLDAPRRLTQFIEGRALQVFMKPTGFGMQVFGRGTSMMFSVLRRITGVDLLEDLAEFFQAFSGMVGGFRERARTRQRAARRRRTSFLVVCGPQGEPISEAVYFHRKLDRGGAAVRRRDRQQGPLRGQARRRRRADSGKLSRAGSSQSWATRRWRTRVAANFDDFRQLSARDRRNVEHLADEMRTRAVIQVPYLDHDVHDLAGLMRDQPLPVRLGHRRAHPDRCLGLTGREPPGFAGGRLLFLG